MKIFSASQIKACDAYTVHALQISSSELMERAAHKCFDWICEHFGKDSLFVVLCGTGNNGGDGLVLTRLLHQAGYGVKAFQLRISNSLSHDGALAEEKLKKIDENLLQQVLPDTYITDIPANVVIVDAIFGTGLNRPLEGWPASFIRQINQLPNLKIAIDIPSGMPADTIPGTDAAILHANHTLSFQFYKRAFLHEETGEAAGTIHLLDIGLSPAFIEATHTYYRIITRDTLLNFFRPRKPFSHKGTYGNALLIGGSHGMMGAIALSTRAASRAGAGKVRCLVPRCGYNILQTLTPEAMCSISGENHIADLKHLEPADAIGLGPGLGTADITFEAFEDFLEVQKEPMVVDADALNLLARKKGLLNHLPANSILTPHPKEFERIFGEAADSLLRLEHARTQAMRYNIVIVLKGRYTAVCTPEGECWYNINGNAGLATGGSGDVLTGIITALLAQRYEPVEAAMLGVYLHGVAAEKALEHQSQESLIAWDLTNYLGSAFKELLAS